MKSCGLVGRLLAGWRFEVCFAGHKMSLDTYQSIIKYFNENKLNLLINRNWQECFKTKHFPTYKMIILLSFGIILWNLD
jgi:hypothetical protein